MKWTESRKRPSGLQWLLGAGFALLLWALMGGTAYAQLEDFNITWETGAEIDVAGFNLYRSAKDVEERTPISERLVGPRGEASQGASYTFRDRPGAGVAALHGPVMVSTLAVQDQPANRLFLPLVEHP